MHKKGFFGSKQQAIPNPLIDLISFRSKLSNNRESLNPKLSNYLSNIPSLENKEIAKLNKSKTSSDAFHHAAPKCKFDLSVITFLTSNEIKPPTDDSYTVITCYQFFSWLYFDQKKGDNEKIINLFIKCLIKIINTPIQSVINYVFSEIVNYIVNNSAFKFQDEFCSDIIRYFECNLTLESSLFSQFMAIVKKLFGCNKYTSETLNMIVNLITQKAPILDVQDNEPLIILLQPHIQSLNPSALHVLALLSANTTTKSSRLSDSFVLIINSIVQNITSSASVHVISIPSEDNNNNLLISGKELLPHDKKDLIFLPSFEFIDLFVNPPFDFFDSKTKLSSFMSPRTREICKMISVCIKSANQICKNNFAKMFLSHLQITQSTKIEVFPELAATFFMLYKNFESTEIIQDSILPGLAKTIIFNPQLHVFLETPLDPSINAFRESTIEMIHLYCPSDIFGFLKQLKSRTTNYCFIFIEMLIRILNHVNWFPLKMIQSKNNFYITLMEISRQLQSLNMKYSADTSSPILKTIISARNSLMVFISNLLLNPLSSPSYISSQAFIHGFYWLIFEPSLTYTVLHTICDSISRMNIDYTNNSTFNNFLNFTVSVINTCKNNYNNDSRYEMLAKTLSHELVGALYQNPYFSLNFLPILLVFLNFLNDYPNKEILYDSLIYLNIYSSADSQFQLSGFLLKLFYKTIKTVEGTNISKHTENMLFSLLQKSVSSHSDDLFFITTPSALPLLLAVFGSTESNSERMVKLIHHLCEFSDYNKIMCHDGEVDLILIQYACLRGKSDKNVTIQYHGCEFTLVFSESVFRSHVLPLIMMISNSKSENEDAHYFIDHLINSEDSELCFFLTQLVSKSQTVPKPLFSLGSDFTQFTVDGIHTSDFENNGFTIQFMINIDKEYLKEKEMLNLTIIKFRDTNNETFSIYLNQSTLYAKQESDTVRTIVNVVKNIPGSSWVHVVITVLFTQEAVVISNYMNNKKLPDSELSPFSFTPGEVKVTVGGIEKEDNNNNKQNDWRNQQLLLLGAIKLIKGSLSPEDVPKLQGKNNFSVLFDSNIIKEPSSQSVYSTPRGDVVNTGLFGKSITDIVINVQPSPPAPQSLVDILIKRHDCCQLSYYFSYLSKEQTAASCYPAMILGLINELFKKDIECQINFNSNYINVILGHLFKNPRVLNANLYFAFYDVLKNITYQPLIKPWFDSFILNTWLWSMCDYQDYLDIIMHYSHVLIVDYRDMFKENSYFSSLFNQTMLLFALDDEGKHETSIADVPPLLNSTYNEKAILHCQDLFLVFLARIGTINLNEMDVASIIAHVSGWKTKSTLIKLLKMVFDISATLINVEGYENNCIPCIQSLIQLNDVDIIDHALVILPELVKEDRLNYLINAAFKVMKCEKKEQVFNAMIKRLIRSPSQYVVLSILSIDLKGDSAMKLGNELDRIVFDDYVNYKINPQLPLMWFLFPLLLAFHSDDSSMEKICRFIIFILSKQLKKNFENHCNMIFAFTTIIITLTKFWDSKVPFYLAKYLFNNSFKEKYSCIAQNVIFVALFKTFSFERKNVLIDEFKKSKFYDDETDFKIEEEKNPSLFQSIDETKDPFFMLNFLASNDIKLLLKIKFVLDLEEERNKIKPLVSSLLGIAYDIMNISKTFNESEMKVIKYFAQQQQQQTTTENNNDNIDTFSAMAEADEVLDKYRELYQERLNSCLLNGQKELQGIELFVHQNQANINNDEANDMSCIAEFQMKAEYKCHLDSIPDVNEMNEISKRRNMFDQTLCSFFCPFKVKSIKSNKRKKDKTEFFETIFEHSALLLSFNKKPLPVSFRLNKKYILILANSKTRTIKLNSIEYVLPRCQGNGLEFVCINGKSYLLNFQSDFPQILKALNSVKFPKCLIFIHNESMSPSGFQKRWLTDQLSNFDYILRLNMIAGRSFKDRSIYPIFPSILRDYNDISSVKTSFEKFRLSEGKSDIKIDFSAEKGIKESFNEFDFVRADYFFRPESIDYVPKSWARDEFEVVYKLRSILESPEITSILHKWINNCFKKYSARFLNIQTFRSDHLQHSSSSSSSSQSNNNNNKGLNMIKKIEVGSHAPSGTIIAASALSSTIFLVLSSNGYAYYIVMNTKETQSSPALIDSLASVQNSSNSQVDDVEINYSSLLLNPPSGTTANSSSSPSSPSSLSSSKENNQANAIAVSVVSSFKAQQVNFQTNEDDNFNNSNSILNVVNSNSSISDDNGSGSGVLAGSVNRKSVGSDLSQGENESVVIKRSGSSHINPVPSMGSFESLNGLKGINNINEIIQESFTQNASFGFTRGKIVWYLPNDNKARLIGDERVINEVTIFPELPFISCCNEDIFYCSDGCTVSVVSPSQTPYPICSTKSRISAMVADEVFHIIVVGTKDGYLHIFRSNDGSLVKSIDLSIDDENDINYEERFKEVRKIVITAKWGLIVVNILSKVKVFNVNGLHLMDIDMPDQILKWFTYSNNKSFDFIVFENVEHKIGFFDPLKKDSVQYFYETMEPLPLISFIPSINSFAFLSESKQITLVPHP